MKVELDGLSKFYGDHAALDGASYASPDLRVLALIGPSGGGKSTLLRLLGGLLTPDAGSMSLDRQPVPSSEPALRLYRQRHGFLFQSFNLFLHLSALENVALPLRIVHGQAAEPARERALACLERFGLKGQDHKRPLELSGGQQQRVALARAIAPDPERLLLDEPTSALDPVMTAEVLEAIHELAREGRRIILSTHEMGFARAVADEIVFLAKGKVLEHGAPAAFFGAPQTEEARGFLRKLLKYNA